MRLAPVPATLLLASAAAAARLALGPLPPSPESCSSSSTGRARRRVRTSTERLYRVSASCHLAVPGRGSLHVLWSGPTLPVLGPLDVTSEEIEIAALHGLRLSSLALAFSVYAILVDHDRLLASAAFARRSALRSHSRRGSSRHSSAMRPDSPKRFAAEVSRSPASAVAQAPLAARRRLARARPNLAEAMEASGFGRPGPDTGTGAPWAWDKVARRPRPSRRRRALWL